MPPRSSLTSSFSVSDATNEVVCPLKNQDGSNCRKRCFGEKRYRSMQEHIRRAHPEHYIPKLPATEESFQLMINTPPSERPKFPQPDSRPPGPYSSSNNVHKTHNSSGFGQSPKNVFQDENHQGPRKQTNEFRRGSLLHGAAAALAQLHGSRPEGDWDSDPDGVSDSESKRTHHSNFFAQHDSQNILSEPFPSVNTSPPRQHGLFPPLARTPSGRASSMQPFSRSKPNRPRKSSITDSARRPKHERTRSKEFKKLMSHDRKAYSAEPQGVAALLSNKKWEDLLDAAASATEEESRDLTPIPQSPNPQRGSPFPASNLTNFQSYTASPLQHTIKMHTPDPPSPPFIEPDSQPLPSVESPYDDPNQRSYHQQQSSGESNTYRPYHHHQQSSGSNFHIPSSGLSTSPKDRPQTSASAHSATSPNSHFNFAHPAQPAPTSHHAYLPQQAPAPPLVQHYCAACNRITALTTSYACTECICGICRECVDVLVSLQERGGKCPKCGTMGGRYKPFMLDLR